MNPTTQPRPRVASEREAPVDYFCRRLRILGASQEEIAEVREHWDDFDEDWTPEKRASMLGATDRTLRQAIQSGRDEYPYEPPHPPDEEMEEDNTTVAIGAFPLDPDEPGPSNPPRPSIPGLSGPPGGLSGDPGAKAGVKTILAWVGRDKDRARTAMARELARAEEAGEEPRESLTSRLAVTMREG